MFGSNDVTEILREFADYLHVTNVISDMFRLLGWWFVRGFAWMVDGLELVVDEILLIQRFFQNPEIQDFLLFIRPLLVVLLAFSLLYVGYLLIFQKQFKRDAMIANLFIAIIIIGLLAPAMDRASDFTSETVDVLGTDVYYPEDTSATMADGIIKRNVTDLVVFDRNGWETTELEVTNDFPPSKAKLLDIRERFSHEGLKEVDVEISEDGKIVSKTRLSFGSGGVETTRQMEQGSFKFDVSKEYYYRYHIDWLNLLVTLGVMAFTLFSIALKLARISFDLAFNYILAILVAPVDVHDGQKTKKVLEAILNSFITIILIFVSMKVYIIGMDFLAETLTGLAYLIALIAFSVAVLDGPNIVERLFGMDAGLKNGWAVAAGTYAGAKLVIGAGQVFGKGADALTGGKLGEVADSASQWANRNRPSPSNGSSGSKESISELASNQPPQREMPSKNQSDSSSDNKSQSNVSSESVSEQASKESSSGQFESNSESRGSSESISELADRETSSNQFESTSESRGSSESISELSNRESSSGQLSSGGEPESPRPSISELASEKASTSSISRRPESPSESRSIHGTEGQGVARKEGVANQPQSPTGQSSPMQQVTPAVSGVSGSGSVNELANGSRGEVSPSRTSDISKSPEPSRTSPNEQVSISNRSYSIPDEKKNSIERLKNNRKSSD